MDKFRVSVALAIFPRDIGGASAPVKCAFYDRDGVVCLPTSPVTKELHANEAAILLLKKVVSVDPTTLHVLPIGFFDPIDNKDDDREILLGYRVFISPGMPIDKNLEFKDHEQLRIAAERISKNHFRVFRAALYV